jgi:hypothetical protein
MALLVGKPVTVKLPSGETKVVGRITKAQVSGIEVFLAVEVTDEATLEAMQDG